MGSGTVSPLCIFCSKTRGGMLQQDAIWPSRSVIIADKVSAGKRTASRTQIQQSANALVSCGKLQEFWRKEHNIEIGHCNRFFLVVGGWRGYIVVLKQDAGVSGERETAEQRLSNLQIRQILFLPFLT